MSGQAKKKFKIASGTTVSSRAKESVHDNDDDEDVLFIETVSAKISVKSTLTISAGAKPWSSAISRKASFNQPLRLRGNSSSATSSSVPNPTRVQTSLKNFFAPRNLSKSSSSDKVPATSSVSVKTENLQVQTTEIVSATFSSTLPSPNLDGTNENSTALGSRVRIEEPIFSDLPELNQGDLLDSSDDDFLSNVPDDLLNFPVPSDPEPSISMSYTKAVIKSGFSAPELPPPSSSFGSRTCPFYKILPGTAFAVDAFNFGVIPEIQAYLLSHFHSDHYIGLTRKFARPIFCSRITAALVKRKLGVDSRFVNELPMNSPVTVHGMEVTLLDANHCPGSVLFLIKLPDGRVYLHTGDFRADPKIMSADPHLQKLKEISKIYLDTTYLDPNYDFDSQDATVEMAAELALKAVANNPKTLIVCGTYSVGKEKIFMRIAKALGSKVAVTPEKLKLLQCFEWKEFDTMLTKEWSFAQVHVLPMFAVKSFEQLEDHLAKYRNFNAILSIVPSGWQYNRKLQSLKDIKPKTRGAISILGLPYSEHSSYKELEWFVQHFRPKEVIPTVNVGNPRRRQAMQKIIAGWMENPTSGSGSKIAPAGKKQNRITDFFAK